MVVMKYKKREREKCLIKVDKQTHINFFSPAGVLEY